MRVIFLFLVALLTAAPVQGASRAEPAYRDLVLQAGYPWGEGLILSFPADESECRRAYGGKWQRKCAAAPGIPGSAAKGIKLSPAAEGRWIWRDGASAVFEPASGASLKPDTVYSADIAGLRLPSHTSLKKKAASVRTLPLSASLQSASFLLDPAPAGKHRLNMAFAFNFPVPESAFKPDLVLPKGAKTGEPEIVWNQARDQLNISWPVTTLPERAGDAALKLAGMGKIWRFEGEPRFIPAEQHPAFGQTLPARDGVFNIKRAAIRQDRTGGKDLRYILELETSLYAQTGDVAKNLLAIELPEFKSGEALLPYDWSGAARIDAQSVKKGRLLRPLPLQPENARQSVFKFELPARSGRHVFVAIDDDLSSSGGIRLSRKWHGALKAEPFQGQAGFLQPGNLLARGAALDFFGNDLDAIEWKLELIRKPFLALIAQSSSQPFDSPLEDFYQGADALSESRSGKFAFPAREQGRAQYASLDPGKEIQALTGARSGLALVTIKGIQAGKEVSSARKLILVSDLAILAKRSANGDLDCFAHNPRAFAPASGARFSLLGANGKPVAEAVADADGHAVFGQIAGYAGESRPVALLAESDDGDLAWMPLEDKSRQLNYSGFQTGGSHIEKDGLIACVFNQRGLYRPGDELFFGCIPRMADFALPDADLPLYAELSNPAGRKIWSKVFRPGRSGIAELSWKSAPESPSGKYILNIRTGENGPIIGSASVRVESFQPDTLKMKVVPPPCKGWIIPEKGLKAAIDLQNLYGSPAGGHRVRAGAATAPAAFRFAGYEDYNFSDPAPFLGNGASQRLPETRTDAEGRAEIALPAELMGASANFSLFAEGFDAAGGRATSASASFLVSPASRILGFKPLGALTNLEFAPMGEEAAIRLQAIDNNLRPVEWPGLIFSLLRRKYVTSLVSDGSGGYRYDDAPEELVLATWKKNIPANGLDLKLDTSSPGEFLLLARDAKDNIVARVPYNVAGDRVASSGDALAESKMRMRLDKKEYNSGDTIDIAFSLPYDAIGLAAIERDKVETFKWFKAHAGDNTLRLALPPDFAGKGYATLAFMRSPDSDATYMTPLAFAVEPFQAGVARHDPGIKLKAPASVQPGEILEVAVSAKNPCQAIVYAVDEGILQLTRWRDPDPLAAILSDRALDVSTLQTADLLMPDRARIRSRLSAFGGGAELAQFGARFQNPFKRKQEPPLAFWSGLIAIGPDPAIIKIPVASWQAGRIRIYAVGAGGEMAGAAATGVAVKAPLLASVALPNSVAPGDIFGGTIVLDNTTGSEIPASIALAQSGGLEIIKAPPAKATIPPRSTLALPFTQKALDCPGEAILAFEVKTPDVALKREARLSLRPASPSRATLQTGIIAEPVEIRKERNVYPRFASAELSLSSIPLPFARGLNRFLDAYPYGCSEQLISRSFGALLFSSWPEFASGQAGRDKLIAATLAAISGRFNGQFVALWPGGSDGDLLLTAYAADFLLSLRESGLADASGLLASICDSISWNLALNEPSLTAARASAYAIWTLAREGRVVTQQLETLQRSLAENDIEWRHDITAALIAAIRAELALPPDFDPALIDFESCDGWFDEYGQRALLQTLIARYFPEFDTAATRVDFLEASERALGGGNYSTFSASQGMRALLALSRAGATDLENVSVRCLEGSAEPELVGKLLIADSAQCERFEIKPGDRPLFWQLSIAGYDRAPASESRGIEISRAFYDQDGNPLTTCAQGDEIEVRITARSERGAIKDCAISDLLPGGLEIIIPRDAPETPKGVKMLDRQEDRLLIFADLGAEPLEISYRVRAIAPGIFAIPPITAEAMYDQAIYGSGAAGKLEISEPR